MPFIAKSTKERYTELLKNPLVFSKFDIVEELDEHGFPHSREAWTSCDPTIDFQINENDLEKNNLGRRLFVISKQKDQLDEEKNAQDDIEFELIEFDETKMEHWSLVFCDCAYNYQSGNQRHCHMSLFWTLYYKRWTEECIIDALRNVDDTIRQTVCYYISKGIFAFSSNKQTVLVSIFRRIDNNLTTCYIGEIEDLLHQMSPSTNFMDYGFYDKIDFIINFGEDGESNSLLQNLYASSRYCLIHFKYWLNYTGNKLYDYSILKYIYSIVDPKTQLSIVKRYLHDVRLNIINLDFSLISWFRDCEYKDQIDIRYFITNPGDNLNIMASMFCDTLLTLNNTQGQKLQDFNGILDFAVTHSNKTYPKIDLGIKNFLPSCDGGLKPNRSFIGFINYVILYQYDASLVSKEKLEKLALMLLNKYTTRRYHNCCVDNNDRTLNDEELNKCQCLTKISIKNEEGEIIETHYCCAFDNNKIITKKEGDVVGKDTIQCNYLKYMPVNPDVWDKRSNQFDNILGVFIDNVSEKDCITSEDVNLSRLKAYINRWATQNSTFKYINGYEPDEVKNDVFVKYFVDNFFKETEMLIYPNGGLFYSNEKSILGLWTMNESLSNSQIIDLAESNESPEVYRRTFESLKRMCPDAVVKDKCIKIPYNGTKLQELLAFFHYKSHEYDPRKGYSETPYFYRRFLSSQKPHYTLYCTPKAAQDNDKVTGLTFVWCRSNECYCTVLDKQTLNSEDNWKNYTLYHAAEIIGYQLIRPTNRGNIPNESVSNFAAEVYQAERFYSRLKCKNCGHMIFSTRGSLLGGSRHFSCENVFCSQYRQDIYLSQCNTCKKGLIDSRVSKKCENGWVICPSCLSCCNDGLLDSLIARHRRNGRVPSKLLEIEGKGHNNKGIFFCPKCSTQLRFEVIEEKDSDGNVIDSKRLLLCPNCKSDYTQSHEKFKECL